MRRVSMAIAALLVAPAAWAQPAATRPAEGPLPPVVRQPEYAGAARIPDDVLDPDAHQVVVLPTEPLEAGEDRTARSGGAIASIPPDLHRLPEGYVVAARGARIERTDKWYEAILEPAPGLPESPRLRLLPNGRLATLEAVLADGGQRSFVVTGRVTEFYGHNYLLLESLLEGSTAGRQEPSTPAATAPTREPTAEEVLRQLMQERPRRSLVLPGQPGAAATRPANTAADPAGSLDAPRWAEGGLLADQPGRVIPGDTWWTFAFEDPTTMPRETPIRLLPSQLLETAISLSGGGARGVVLIVSGEFTVHRGANYLLLRKVLVRRDLGNLR